ncbi:MAG: ATP-binding protein [Nannocystaceae bacterium]
MGTLLDPLDADAYVHRLELVLAGTRLGLWDWNPQTDEVIFDERWADMLGHTLDEIPFTLESWSSRVHPDDLPACYADIRAHMEGRTPFYENVPRMRHKSGRWVHILDRGRIVERDPIGRPIRFTGSHTDISAQREAEAAALELARGRTRFLATISHEIRTPMHGVLGLLEEVLCGELSADQRNLVELVQRSCLNLTTLINDVLDFTRASEGKLQVTSAPFDLRAIVLETRALFRARAAAKGLTLTYALAPGLGDWVQGDGARVRQSLVNLIHNAVKFTARGEVRVSVARVGDEIRFAVADTGPGIADLDRIFHPYEQEETGVAHGGAGLGLAIVRQLVEAMGGAIAVESDLGSGSTFTVRLPLPTTSPPMVVVDAAVEVPQLRVLITDDDVINQLVARALLERGGHDVTAVNTGLEAVSELSVHDYDVVLMDLNMPELNGDLALSLLRARGIRVPVIATTADASSETRSRRLGAGFSAFLSKPFNRAELTQALITALRA